MFKVDFMAKSTSKDINAKFHIEVRKSATFTRKEKQKMDTEHLGSCVKAKHSKMLLYSRCMMDMGCWAAVNIARDVAAVMTMTDKRRARRKQHYTQWMARLWEHAAVFAGNLQQVTSAVNN
jgi:hypothetical protein